MSLTRIMALALRIIRQVLRDKRTLALIFVIWIFVMAAMSAASPTPAATP